MTWTAFRALAHAPVASRRWVAVIASAALLALVAPTSARAQRLFGSVVLADDVTPAPGAIVTATDSAGIAAGRELTTTRGDFVLPLAHGGKFTITVLRLGSLPETVRDVVVERGRDLRIRIRIARDTPRPPSVAVRSGELCNVRGDTGAIGHAWSQFLIVLATAEMAAESKAFSGTWLRTERNLAKNLRDTVARSDSSVVIPLDGIMMPAIPPDSSRIAGFVIESEDGVLYHTPDVTTLASRAFLARRCFSFDPPPPGQPGWTGLHFRSPDFRVGVVDVEGTLWIDRATLEPRGLGFRYVNLPPSFAAAESGGTLRFRQLPTGHWIVEEWTLRVPAGAFRRIFSYDQRGALSGYATKLTLDGVRITALRLMELELNGSPIFRRP